MKFQPGQSGNPAGRPPGSLNRKTLTAQAVFEAHAEEVVESILERAKNGHATAMRLVMQQAVPSGRNRRFALELPAVKTADDAQAAVAAVLAEFAAGKLAIHELASLLVVIERMLRLAERIWKMREAERERTAHAAQSVAVPTVATAAEVARDRAVPMAASAKPADASGERLYFPVNSQTREASERTPAGADAPSSSGDRAPLPQAKAA